jgi:hypothetical protein
LGFSGTGAALAAERFTSAAQAASIGNSMRLIDITMVCLLVFAAFAAPGT